MFNVQLPFETARCAVLAEQINNVLIHMNLESKDPIAIAREGIFQEARTNDAHGQYRATLPPAASPSTQFPSCRKSLAISEATEMLIASVVDARRRFQDAAINTAKNLTNAWTTKVKKLTKPSTATPCVAVPLFSIRTVVDKPIMFVLQAAKRFDVFHLSN